MGSDAEQKFVDCIKSTYPNCKVTKATMAQDIHEHWDYKLSNSNTVIKIDVKAQKRKNRSDANSQSEIIWIEFKNVRGYKGWLYGDADLVAFEQPDSFVLIKRTVLAELCERLVGLERDQITIENSTGTRGLYKLYNRPGRSDVLTMIKMDDILSESHKILNK